MLLWDWSSEVECVSMTSHVVKRLIIWSWMCFFDIFQFSFSVIHSERLEFYCQHLSHVFGMIRTEWHFISHTFKNLSNGKPPCPTTACYVILFIHWHHHARFSLQFLKNRLVFFLLLTPGKYAFGNNIEMKLTQVHLINSIWNSQYWLSECAFNSAHYVSICSLMFYWPQLPVGRWSVPLLCGSFWTLRCPSEGLWCRTLSEIYDK